MRAVSLLLVVAFLSSSCSKTIKEVHHEGVSDTKNSSKLQTEVNQLEAIQKILDSDAPNLALAELLIRTVPQNERKKVEEVLFDMSPAEVKSIINKIGKDNDAISSQYVFHGMNYQVNDLFLDNSLLNMSQRASEAVSIEDKIKVSVFTYMKNKTLDEILETYNKRVEELSKELAVQIAYEIATETPSIASEIEKSVKNDSKAKAIEAISKTKPILEKIDKYLKGSGLNENEQYTVLGTGILVGAIYLKVKDNDGFKRIVDEGKKIARDIKKLIEKGKEFMALASTLEIHFKGMEENVKDLRDGLEGSRNDFREMLEVARTSVHKPSNIHSKRIMEFLYKKVIKGEDIKSESSHPSVLSKQSRINENINKSLNAVGNIADNLSNVLVTTHKMMALFNMKPSKSFTKLIDKAQKVAQVVSTVKNVVAGWALGGPMGALAAFGGSSGGLAAAFGGGSDNNAAEFKLINMKLDRILENQQKIMEVQIETMKMVKDLALLVDEYHQTQMQALSELRDISLVNLEINKTLLNKDIRSCERMINFQLSSVWKDIDFKMDSFHGINDLKVINSRFYNNIKSLNDIRRINNSVEVNGFEKCQNGIVEAFGGNSVSENPLRSLFSSSENENLLSFQRETYLPLLGLVYAVAETTEMNSIPLHIPSANLYGVLEKAAYIQNAKTETDGSERFYDLENLVSTKGLERYLGQLLLLYPFLELDKGIWEQDIESIVTNYLRNSNSDSNQNIRSYYFLSNALKLVQSALAQETILAGEPLLLKLHDNYFEKIVSSEKCEDVIIENTVNACPLRQNKLLMKNLLIFKTSLRARHYHGDFAKEYKEAFETRKLDALAKLISLNLTGAQIRTKIIDEEMFHFLVVKDEENKDIEIRLPQPEGVAEGALIYSENMDHLLQMQKAIIENLEKIAPLKRSGRGDDLSKVMLIGVN